MKRTERFTVVGCLEGHGDNHEFGDYATLREAKQAWRSHDGVDGDVRIEDNSQYPPVVCWPEEA